MGDSLRLRGVSTWGTERFEERWKFFWLHWMSGIFVAGSMERGQVRRQSILRLVAISGLLPRWPAPAGRPRRSLSNGWVGFECGLSVSIRGALEVVIFWRRYEL